MDNDRSRLIWRCRRGIREMDIVLQTFLNESYNSLSETDKNIFSWLLDEADLDILNWIIGKDTPENDDFKKIITIIQNSSNIT